MTTVQKKQLPAFLVLTIISLVAAIVLAGTNELTKGPIAEHAARARREAFSAVLSAYDYQEQEIPEGHDKVTSLYKAVDEAGNELGYTVVAAAPGYAGAASPVAVTLGIGPDGMVTGAVIGDTNFAETAGFGMKWKEETNRWEQFKSIDTVNGGSIETITSATITSNAVLTATNAAINCVNEVRGVAARDVVTQGAPAAPVIEQTELVGGIHEGSAQGFQSEVRVQLTMDDAGVVTGLNIDATKETPGFGTRATEEKAFAEQFVGKSAPFAIGSGIDALAGATVTSKAVVEAVNAACDSPENPDAVPFDLGGDAAEEEPAVEVSAEPLLEGALVGKAQGFQSEVVVTVSVDANNVITGVVIASGDETPGFGTRCGEDAAFAEQFIGKTIPVEGVEALSGATVTSKAVIAAVNAAAAPVEETPAVGETVAELTGKAQGFQSEVVVTVSVDANNVITGVVIASGDETPGFGTRCGEDAAFAEQFIGKTIPVEGVEALSGATVTSKAVIAAVNAAAAPVEETPAASETVAELTGKAQGFQSEVVVTLTVENDVITGIKVDSSNETPGFGTRCGEDEAFLAQFVGKKATPDLGEGIDALSGATVTSNAVVAAANAAIGVEEAVELTAEAPVEPVAVVETKTAKGEGFMDYVVVTVGFAEDGTIATLEIDVSNELPPACDLVLADGFINQFIGKKGPFVVGEGIDVASGATYSSNGAIAALNSLFPAEEEAAAAEILTATGSGFGEGVVVNVTLNEDGTIATLAIDVSGEVPPICDKVLAEDFINQFIGEKGPFVAGEGVDVVAGATYSSNGVIEALNSLFPTQDMSVTGEEGPEAPAAPVVVETKTAKGEGFMDYVVVTVGFAEDGTIATLEIDVSNELPPACDLVLADSFVSQFIGKKGPFVVGEGVDVASGATYSSNGAIAALNSLFPAEEEVAAAEILTATGSGFGEGVVVNVTLNEDGTIATLAIDVSGEVPPICDKVLAEDFINQFIGKKGPFVAGEGVDVVAGATFSSNGVIEALNKLFPEATETTPADAETPAGASLSPQSSSLSVSSSLGGTVSADAQTVSITVNANGPWTAMTDASWIRLNMSSGSGGSTVMAAVAANASSNERTGRIIFTCSTDTQTVTITQEKADAAAFDVALAAPVQTNLSERRAVPVYSGPGMNYYRAAGGKAEFTLNGEFYLWGCVNVGDDVWYMVTYETMYPAHRTGYIRRHDFSGSLEADALTFASEAARTTRDVGLTDDPFGAQSCLFTLKKGTDVTYLGTCTNNGEAWYYIECVYVGEMVRGFIPAETLELK